MKKTLSILLALLMLISVFPLSVFAAEVGAEDQIVPAAAENDLADTAAAENDLADTGVTKITYVNGLITAPVAGKHPSFSPTASSSTYTVSGVEWHKIESNNNETSMTSAGFFRANHRYKVGMYVTAASGYEFAIYGSDTSGFTAAINGKTATLFGVPGKSRSEKIWIEYTFPALADTGLQAVAVNIAKPLPYSAPSYSPSIPFSSAAYEVEEITGGGLYMNGVYWYDETDKTIIDPSNPEKCKPFHEYTVTIALVPKDGYVFCQTTSQIYGTINGDQANVLSYSSRDPDRSIRIKYTFTCEFVQCQSIDFNNIKEPCSDAPADFTAPTAANPVEYSVYTSYSEDNFYNGVAWYDLNAKEYLAPGDTFTSYHKYICYVAAVVTDAYIFTDPVSGTINGNTATVAQLGAYSKGGFRMVFYTFDAKIGITSVAVSGVIEPVDGRNPDFTATIPKNVNYLIEEDFNAGDWNGGLLWKNETDGGYLSDSDTFEAGKKYSVTVSLVCKNDDYAFIPGVTGTLNGFSAKITPYSGGDYNIGVKYTFTAKAPTEIHQVEIGVTEPRPGFTPNYNTVCPSGKGYMVKPYNYSNTIAKGVMWTDKTNNITMTSVDTFVAGREYTVTVYLIPTSIYYVFKSPITSTINGKGAGCAVSSDLIILQATFVCSNVATVNDVRINVTEPIAGAKPSYSAVVPTGSGYAVRSEYSDDLYQNGVRWSRYENGVYYVHQPTESFIGGKQYRVIVLLKPSDSQHVFDSTVYGRVNNQTASVRQTPEYQAYRYIEYTFTCPGDPSTATVSGIVTSYLTKGNVKVQLLKNGAVVNEATIANHFAEAPFNDAFEFSNVAQGSYTLRFSKTNHVTREITFTVDGDTVEDARIHPIGDFNGDGQVTTADVLRANSHAKGKKTLTDPYQFACLDVVGTDKSVSTADVLRLNSHAKGKKLLW